MLLGNGTYVDMNKLGGDYKVTFQQSTICNCEWQNLDSPMLWVFYDELL